MNILNEESFQYGSINLVIQEKPVSSQNKSAPKLHLKEVIRNITSFSEYIITSRCWVEIQYYSSNFNRYKNPGLYDLDNIIKPILDSLIGLRGVLLDDSLFERVIVNWIDTPHDDHFEIKINYPDLLYVEKASLMIVKSSGGWCFPTSELMVKLNSKIIHRAFEMWGKVNNEEDYYSYLRMMPIQEFIYYSKIKDKNYEFIDLANI